MGFYCLNNFNSGQSIKFVKNWDKEFNDGIFAAMKRFFPQSKILKAFT